jgi:MoaA/NifB/PqqE/SkfB family radical SAM enzyme
MNKENWICLRPWQRFEIFNYYNREVNIITPCCSSWLKPELRLPHIINKHGMNNAWNGKIMQNLRRSVLDGTYEFCNIKKCPYYKSKIIEYDTEIILNDVKDKKLTLNHGPIILSYSGDKSCNLKCQSCRNDYINTKSFGFNTFIDCINKDILKIELMGSGEVFYSKTILNFLRNFSFDGFLNVKNIAITTNGTLLNEEMWESLGNNKKLIKEIQVSVDAATKESYEKIRGFDFNVLFKNLNFISKLRENNEINEFIMSMVIQKDNINEIKDFCNMAKKTFNVDVIRLNIIDDWGHIKKELWDKMKINEDDEIYKGQIRKVRDWINKNKQVKIMHNLW